MQEAAASKYWWALFIHEQIFSFNIFLLWNSNVIHVFRQNLFFFFFSTRIDIESTIKNRKNIDD